MGSLFFFNGSHYFGRFYVFLHVNITIFNEFLNIESFKLIVILFSLIVILLLVFLLLWLQFVFFNEETISRYKLEALESGFERLELGYIIGAPFFFLAVLFVLFDLELLLLLPRILFYNRFRLIFYIIWVILILFIFITLILEWAWCGLKWFI